jgi:hypothetical protein
MSTIENIPEAVTPPTADSPEVGEISSHGVLISNAEHWVEHGRHVFRSLEFDVSGDGEDIPSAVSVFVENAEDLCELVTELIREGDATEHEIETASVLVPRFMSVYRQHDRQLRRPLASFFGARRRHSREWRARSKHETSSPPLHA